MQVSLHYESSWAQTDGQTKTKRLLNLHQCLLRSPQWSNQPIKQQSTQYDKQYSSDSAPAPYPQAELNALWSLAVVSPYK